MMIREWYSEPKEMQEMYLSQIGSCDWTPGRDLAAMIRSGKISEVCGDEPKLLLLTDGETVVSFCTLTVQDDIKPTSMTPWIGYLYTAPAFRGHRYAGQLLARCEALAAQNGQPVVYLSTEWVGLYEKYDYTFRGMMTAFDGQSLRVYEKRLLPDFAVPDDLADDEIFLRLDSVSQADPEKMYVNAYHFSICRNDDGTVVGIFSFRAGYSPKTRYGGHLGYEIFEPYRGHHYAARASRLVVRFAAVLGMPYVYITCVPENTASARTALAAGGKLVENALVPDWMELYEDGYRAVLVYRLETGGGANG